MTKNRVHILWEDGHNIDRRVVAVFETAGQADVVKRFLQAGETTQSERVFFVMPATYVADPEEEAADAPF